MDVIAWLKQMGCCDMRGTGWSNLRKDQSCEMALKAAIHGGMYFPRDTFSKVGIWHAEWMYRMACEVNNRSACVAIELHLGRPPFWWEGQRMHEGFDFWHPDTKQRWRINSFGVAGVNRWYANATDATCWPEEKPEQHRRAFDFDLPPKPKKLGRDDARKRMRFYADELRDRELNRKASVARANATIKHELQECL